MILSSGTRDYDNLEIILKYLETNDELPIFICIDIANGYIEDLIKICNRVRDSFPSVTIIAGNVVTPEGVRELVKYGSVDIVKIGIGSGALCTTRKVTGVGYPQLSAIMECSETAHELNAHVIADGGIVNPGDICKAFVAGADFVMLGSYLAGHDISPGIKTLADGDIYKHVYGMSSEHANNKHFGGLKDYKAPEGRSLKIPYKGSISRTLQNIEGGIRSACTYTGSEKISDMRKASFVLVNGQYNTSLEKYDKK
jgi:GMP reductase